jgi:hypothetical protein
MALIGTKQEYDCELFLCFAVLVSVIGEQQQVVLSIYLSSLGQRSHGDDLGD